MAYDFERARIAVEFAREWLRSSTTDKTTASMMASMTVDRLAAFRSNIGNECVDLSLSMADRIIAACTKPVAVVGDELPGVHPDKTWPRA